MNDRPDLNAGPQRSPVDRGTHGFLAVDKVNGSRNLRELSFELDVPARGFVATGLIPMEQDAATVAVDEKRPLLVAVDLSDSAVSVLRMAGELAESLNRPLLVMHVVHDSIAEPGQYRGAESENYSTPMVDVARRKLDGLLSGGVEQQLERDCLHDARVMLVDGIPANRILEVAEREQPKMIVMGSNGRNGMSRTLLGSVAEAVMRSSRVPVTVVKTPKKTLA